MLMPVTSEIRYGQHRLRTNKPTEQNTGHASRNAAGHLLGTMTLFGRRARKSNKPTTKIAEQTTALPCLLSGIP